MYGNLAGLQGEEKDRFNEIAEELSKLSTKFSNNILDGEPRRIAGVSPRHLRRPVGFSAPPALSDRASKCRCWHVSVKARRN